MIRKSSSTVVDWTPAERWNSDIRFVDLRSCALRRRWMLRVPQSRTVLRSPSLLSELTSLVLQEPFLPPEPAAIAYKSSIAPNDPMAGDDERNGVFSIGCAYGTHCEGVADPTGDVLVGCGLSVGDLQELPPDSLLEVRSLIRNRQIKDLSFSRKVFCDLSRSPIEQGVRFRLFPAALHKIEGCHLRGGATDLNEADRGLEVTIETYPSLRSKQQLHLITGELLIWFFARQPNLPGARQALQGIWIPTVSFRK